MSEHARMMNRGTHLLTDSMSTSDGLDILMGIEILVVPKDHEVRVSRDPAKEDRATHMMTVSAVVKLIPTPPARVERR